MLVLTRRAGESVIIGDNIVVTILETGSTVQIGIEAPREVAVWRKELYDEVAGQNREAANTTLPEGADVAKLFGELTRGT